MNDSRTQEERDNEPESTVTYSGTHNKESGVEYLTDRIGVGINDILADRGIEDTGKCFLIDAKSHFGSLIQQALLTAKEEGRLEVLNEIAHEQVKLLDGFSHPKDCELCKTFTQDTVHNSKK